MAEPDKYADVLRLQAPGWLTPKLIGPYIAGYLAALYLAGAFTHQCVNYWLNGDLRTLPRRQSKHVLVALFCLNVVYSAFIFEEAYGLAVRQNRTIAAIIAGTYQWNILPLIGGWTGALTEASLTMRAAGFMTNRIAKIAFYTWMSLLILNICGWATLTSANGFILNVRGGTYNIPGINFNQAVACWMSCAAAADLSISLALAWSLRTRIAGFNRKSDSLLKQLIWVALRTALYTTVITIAGAVVSARFTDSELETTDLNLAFWLPLPPLYGMSFFSTLSSTRRAFATTLNADVPTAARVPLSLSGARHGAGGGGGVRIMVETQVEVDDGYGDELGSGELERTVSRRIGGKGRESGLFPPDERRTHDQDEVEKGLSSGSG
ncbi:hypothetical protein JCM8097_000517 [Rhodosporidiobolus ruineniae]